MNLKPQRRMAAKILKCGMNRVYMNYEYDEDISTAITHRDIRGLINSGVIKTRYAKGVSRSRAKARHLQRKKGRQSGLGSRKGKASARTPRKRDWINKIRSMRAFLKLLRDKKHIDTRTYQKYYYLAKGGTFRNVHQMKYYMQAHGDLKSDSKK
ncbi:MAG: 50S ribosomal protein L19e [Promethearchaeota archaeon]